MNDNEDFPCLNEEAGLECEYPFCDCEAEYYDEQLQELPEIFEQNEGRFITDLPGEHAEEN